MERSQIISGTDFTLAKLIGTSAAFTQMLHKVRKIAAYDVTVLIHGETGTGKELAARAIHYLGSRRDRPFLPVNCGAIPDSLIESEFFGHHRGAFTDAKEHRKGLIAHAEGGTLFLDEIECLSPKGQVALLRFLQEGCYRSVGGREEVRGDVRVVAAGNRDLNELVRTGEFRQDLYYRLAIMPLNVPPLRQRGKDPVLLAEHFVRQFAKRYGIAEKRLSGPSMSVLLSHDWPGNVRELENVVHRELLLADGETIDMGGVGPEDGADDAEPQTGMPFHLGFRRAKDVVVSQFEREFVKHVLAESKGNVSLAAQRAGKERRTFARLIKKYSIDRKQFCGSEAEAF